MSDDLNRGEGIDAALYAAMERHGLGDLVPRKENMPTAPTNSLQSINEAVLTGTRQLFDAMDQAHSIAVEKVVARARNSTDPQARLYHAPFQAQAIELLGNHYLKQFHEATDHM